MIAAVTVSLLAACGVPSDGAPRQIDRDRIPFGLLDPEQPGPTSPAAASRSPADVFLVSGDRLVRAQREVPSPPSAGGVIDALLAGPTDAESARNLRSAIATTSGVTATGPQQGLVRVELGRTFATSGAADQVLAVAQIVYTVTAIEGANRVSFTIGGRPADVPREDGTLTNEPLDRAAFVGVAPS